MNLYLAGVVGVVGIVLGRLSCRRTVERRTRNPRLWWAMAAFLVAANSMISTTYIVGDNRGLRSEQTCRAALATPVNDAQARITAANARGLLVFANRTLNDPEISALIERPPPEGLGRSNTEALRTQAKEILKASAALERANNARGDPVQVCRKK